MKAFPDVKAFRNPQVYTSNIQEEHQEITDRAMDLGVKPQQRLRKVQAAMQARRLMPLKGQW